VKRKKRDEERSERETMRTIAHKGVIRNRGSEWDYAHN
jgi:hypothetical protein